MADLVVVLLHPPVLGPGSWQPVAGELTAAGWRVAVPSALGFAQGGAPYAPRVIARWAEQIPAADRVVLVAHSGAGAFVPAVASAVGGGRVGAVFADAGLPPAAGPVPVVDAGFLPYLRQLARAGVVPPWPQWWPDEDPAEIFPSPAARAAVEAEAGPLPLAFFEEQLPGQAVPDPAGYLLFSAGYQAEAAQAAGRDWPVAEAAGSHLHPLVDPAGVAAALTGLAGRLSW
jgi:hypothetical protein